jgi:hypothetical protein
MQIDKKKISKLTKVYEENHWKEIEKYFLKNNNDDIKLKLIILLSVKIDIFWFFNFLENGQILFRVVMRKP